MKQRPINSRGVVGHIGRLELYRCYAAVDSDMGLRRLFTNEIHYTPGHRKANFI